MKKASLLMILLIVGILVLGASVAYGAADTAEVHSQACKHASPEGVNHANPNSVLDPERCTPGG